MKSKKNVIYAKDGFLMIKIKKKFSNYTKKSDITVITLEHLEKPLIAFTI